MYTAQTEKSLALSGKNFHVPSQYLYKPCKAYVYCPDWKITCPVGHVTTKVYVPWDKIYMPRARGHALM